MTTRKPDPYGEFLSSYLQELVETPDAEILASEKGIASDFGARLLASAKTKAAKRRFGRAREAVAANKRAISSSAKRAITPADARALLARYARDPRLTLAARNLADLSDEDAVRLCQQLQELDETSDTRGKDGA